MSKLYMGTRYPGRTAVTVQNGAQPRVLNPRRDLVNHSPDGFEWGYAGSGPAQLALAISADIYGDEIARQIYQRLKDRIICRLTSDH